MNVVILDDEKDITDAYEMFLKRLGVSRTKAFNRPEKFLDELDSLAPSILFLDLQMPKIDGEEVLETVKSRFPQTSVVIMTGNMEIESAVRCMRKGALDYLIKPIDKDRFSAAYLAALDAYRLQAEITALRTALNSPKENPTGNFHGIITADERMHDLFRYLEAVSKSSFPVLITGETGAGKELFANAVHKCSGRKGAFIAVNVSGLDGNMFSDTLFGHVKGAFTGADKPRRGLLAEADGGTIFLDEIGDLQESAQIKLLRVLQEKVYMPLGSDKNITADVRIVTATNADLSEKVKAGLFRQDLLYRLSTHSVAIPPLRQRKSDIVLLAGIFYSAALNELGIPQKEKLPEAVISSLKNYAFPGNIRQLQAVMADMAAVFADKTPEKEMLAYLNRHGIESCTCCPEAEGDFVYSGSFPTLKQMEQFLVEKAVQNAEGNISLAAKMLGITRQALHKRLKGGREQD